MQYSSLKMLLSSRLYANYVLLMISFIYFSNQLCRYLYSSVRIPFIDYEGSEYASLAGPVFTLCYTFSGIGVGYVADLPTVSRVKLLLCFFYRMDSRDCECVNHHYIYPGCPHTPTARVARGRMYPLCGQSFGRYI